MRFKKSTNRGFNQFILYPIQVLIDSILTEKYNIYEPIMESLRIGFASGTDKYKYYIKLIVNGYIHSKIY